MQRLEGKCLRLLMRCIKQVTQITQPSLSTNGTVQRLHHQAIAGLIERQLYPHLLGPLQINNAGVVRNCHHHTVAIDITDNTRKGEITDARCLCFRKENDRPPVFKVMLYIRVCRAVYLHRQLVERVIVTLAHTERPPGITSLYLPPYTDGLGLLAVGLLLSLIL